MIRLWVLSALVLAPLIMQPLVCPDGTQVTAWIALFLAWLVGAVITAAVFGPFVVIIALVCLMDAGEKLWRMMARAVSVRA